MVMGKQQFDEGCKLGIDFPDLNELYIPRRRRSPTAEKNPPMSTLEAATVLLAMAYSVTDIQTFCNRELEKFSNTRKRKKAPAAEKLSEATAKKPRKKKKKSSKPAEFPSIPEMPAAVRDRIVEMGGYEIRLVIQKQLEDTDITKNHGRLSIPTKKLLFDFATEEETRLLSQQENKNKKGMNVLIIDPVLRERSICLKKWKIGSNDMYCLMTQWNSFVEENSLRSGDNIQLWCFRKDEIEVETQMIFSRLCLAMVKLDVTACA